MRRTLAAALSAWLVVGNASRAAAQSADGWNDARARSLVELATRRRAEQLADTGLVDYRATARGYVSFLVSMGTGFLEAPKVVKTDQLALEVYWHAPNESKQRIVGRRDTLLFPTDIQYHRDHLGIVQNNFPDFIRIGEGDEVADVPHPLSSLGLALYDFKISPDSVRIHLPDRTINLIEVKVRPKNDREPRIIGAIYIDPTGGQVVRMAFNFTHAALLDKDLEDLAIVLENRLVGGRFWLPSQQSIEIRRSGTYLEFPVRGIIRGRWEVGEYQLNTSVPTAIFTGPEIVSAPTQELKKYPWQGTIMDSLPPDLRATVDPDIKGVLDEARGLVREQALQRAQTLRLSAPRISDFVRFNRVEGLAIGGGVSAHLVSNLSFQARGRYGIDDQAGKGMVQLRAERPSGTRIELFASRDFVEVGDEQERSTLINSFAAQEFGSDFTDPYRVDAIGARGILKVGAGEFTVGASRERHRALSLHARSAAGAFGSLPPNVAPLEGWHPSAMYFKPFGPAIGVGDLQLRVSADLLTHTAVTDGFGGELLSNAPTAHGAVVAEYRSDFGHSRIVLREIAAGVIGKSPVPLEQLAYFGGPWSAPGYDYHLLSARAGASTRLEFQTHVPFIAIPLGRFGEIPGQARLAPFVNSVLLKDQQPVPGLSIQGGPCGQIFVGGTCSLGGAYYSVGVGLLTFFEGLRFDVARGFRPNHWTFNVDVNREFWNIL